ncbi:MAG: methyltransferase domain-containing protein [Candidatus Aenigmatarchaeota archaeon]|nr:MAG: methyltransferase domain-containing protein [Candidatus Aenigmarchaeota archaeon]
MGLLKSLYDAVYVKILPNYPVELEKAVGDCKSLLDVGCGDDSPIKRFSGRMETVGIDAFGPSIEESRRKRIHKKYYRMDILAAGRKFGPKSFDCVLASAVVEHLKKRDGVRLIEMMEKLAKKRVIIQTPVGFLPQGPEEGNPWQEHKSGWTVAEMRRRGYRVIGLNGWKPLRGECARLRFWPSLFWLVVSDVTQLFVRNRPERAFEMVCVKDVSEQARPRLHLNNLG